MEKAQSIKSYIHPIMGMTSSFFPDLAMSTSTNNKRGLQSSMSGDLRPSSIAMLPNLIDSFHQVDAQVGALNVA